MLSHNPITCLLDLSPNARASIEPLNEPSFVTVCPCAALFLIRAKSEGTMASHALYGFAGFLSLFFFVLTVSGGKYKYSDRMYHSPFHRIPFPFFLLLLQSSLISAPISLSPYTLNYYSHVSPLLLWFQMVRLLFGRISLTNSRWTTFERRKPVRIVIEHMLFGNQVSR